MLLSWFVGCSVLMTDMLLTFAMRNGTIYTPNRYVQRVLGAPRNSTFEAPPVMHGPHRRNVGGLTFTWKPPSIPTIDFRGKKSKGEKRKPRGSL
jgi:hypothetical protein